MNWASHVPISPNTERGRGLACVAAILALAFTMFAPALHAQTPGPALRAVDDLARDGHMAMQRRVPIVILFSLPGCSYCEVVRRNYLAPLLQDGEPGKRPLVRETDMSSHGPLQGFAGEAGSGSALAKQYGIRVAPSVLVLDGRGTQIAPVLEGGDVAGMYGAYLDDRLATARRAIGTAR
jgi:thioredoxin-related protein